MKDDQSKNQTGLAGSIPIGELGQVAESGSGAKGRHELSNNLTEIIGRGLYSFKLKDPTFEELQSDAWLKLYRGDHLEPWKPIAVESGVFHAQVDALVNGVMSHLIDHGYTEAVELKAKLLDVKNGMDLDWLD